MAPPSTAVWEGQAEEEISWWGLFYGMTCASFFESQFFCLGFRKRCLGWKLDIDSYIEYYVGIMVRKNPFKDKKKYWPKVASVSDIQRDYRYIFDWAKKSKEPVYILKNNRPEVAVLSVDLYEELRQRAEALEAWEAQEAIRVGQEEKKLGKLRELKGPLSNLLLDDAD